MKRSARTVLYVLDFDQKEVLIEVLGDCISPALQSVPAKCCCKSPHLAFLSSITSNRFVNE